MFQSQMLPPKCVIFTSIIQFLLRVTICWKQVAIVSVLVAVKPVKLFRYSELRARNCPWPFGENRWLNSVEPVKLFLSSSVNTNRNVDRIFLEKYSLSGRATCFISQQPREACIMHGVLGEFTGSGLRNHRKCKHLPGSTYTRFLCICMYTT